MRSGCRTQGPAERFWMQSPYMEIDVDEHEIAAPTGAQGMGVFLIVLALVGIVTCLVFKLLEGGGCARPTVSEGAITGRVAKTGGPLKAVPLTSEADLAAMVRATATSKKMLIVMFHASWCGHCKAALPEFLACAQDPECAFCDFAEIDADAYLKEHMGKYGITGFPTYFVFVNGKKDHELPHDKRGAGQMKQHLQTFQRR